MLISRVISRQRLTKLPPVRLAQRLLSEERKAGAQGSNWLQETKEYIQNQKNLLKGTMVSQSTLQFTLPFSSTPIVMPLSLSDLAGHSSFVFLAISYLETDFMQLRMFAVSGVALSIVFQYYREKPLWIPIRWNSVFLLINVMMILLLLKEENDANNIPPEKKAMFESFEKKGMKPVEFLQLITAAKRMEVKKGDTVVSEKLKNTRVYFVKSGQLSVMKNGSKIRTIERNQFTGEMSFLRWENRIDAKIYMNKHQKDTMKQWSNKDSDTELFLPLLIACENLLDQLGIREKPQVTQVAIESQLGGWSRQGSSATTTASAQTAAERELHNEAAFGITVDEKGNVVESSPAEPVSNELQQQNEQTVFGRYLNATYNFVGGLLSAKAQQASDESSPQNAVDGELAAATVVAEEDCVLYFWSFKSLRSLIELYPSMGLAFERALSDDLNRKMVTTMQVEPKQRYQLLLSSAVMDGEPSETSIATLADFRQQNGISAEEHAAVLGKFGWTPRDFEAGFKGAPSAAVMQQYQKQLQAALADSDAAPLSDEARTDLRLFRLRNGINSNAHLGALRKIGWTVDEYEIGSKNPTHASQKENRAVAVNERTKRRGRIRAAVQAYIFPESQSEAEKTTSTSTEEAKVN